MEQLGLRLVPPRARRRDPSTSHVAASRAQQLAQLHYAKIETALKYGAGTIHELAERTGLDAVQIARRLPECPKLFETTGEERPSPKGRPCRVWRLKCPS